MSARFTLLLVGTSGLTEREREIVELLRREPLIRRGPAAGRRHPVVSRVLIGVP